MSEQENVVFNLEVNTLRASGDVKKLETIVHRTLGLYNRVCRILGIPDDSPLNKAVTKVQHLVMIIRQLTTAVTLLQVASGPIGWASAGLAVAGVAVTSVEFMQSAGE